MKIGPIEYKSFQRINLLGNNRFVEKTSRAIALLNRSSGYTKPGCHIRWVLQSRLCLAANRVSRRFAMGPVVHLDIATTRVSTVALASFLVNESKRIELRGRRPIMTRLSLGLFERAADELTAEIECLQHQIEFLKQVAPESRLLANLQFNCLLLKENKFFPSVCSWLERSC